MVWIVAAGSALGGVARYLVGGLVQRLAGPVFPLGTLVVNTIGSIVIGFVMRYALESAAISAEARTFLTIGICGGFTTFSTFSYETVALFQDGSYGKAAASIAANVGLALLGTVAGAALAGAVWDWRRIG